MHHAIATRLLTVALMIVCLGLGFALSRMTLEPAPMQPEVTEEGANVTTEETEQEATPAETIPPSTPLPTLTASGRQAGKLIAVATPSLPEAITVATPSASSASMVAEYAP